MASNTLYVVQGHDHPWLQSLVLTADNASWIAGQAPAGGTLGAKTRYRQADAPCELSAATADDELAGRFELRFASPQWAATPGQSAVLYDGEVCLGGGVIAQVFDNF
jgi:tRNA-specific 2-thiouridylase